MRALTFTCLALAVSSSLDCGKTPKHDESATTNLMPSASAATTSNPEVTPAPPKTVELPKPAQKIELEIASVANTMAYDKIALTVPTGAEVHLTLKNNATMSTLPHNWVLVKAGTEASVAAAGLKLGDKAGYIDVSDHDMIVHTPLAKPGETTDVVFTAPEPGKYPYVCTVPGHYMMMKGTLTVSP
jgi:azurin